MKLTKEFIERLAYDLLDFTGGVYPTAIDYIAWEESRDIKLSTVQATAVKAIVLSLITNP